MTVGEMESRMSNDEMNGWRALARLEHIEAEHERKRH